MRSLAVPTFLMGLLVAASAHADPVPPAAPPADKPATQEQERTANNAVYAEGLGPGLFYSINYDRAFGDVAARIGFGYVSVSATASGGGATSTASASLLTIPITVSYLGIGSKKHMFEVGGGASIVNVGAGGSAIVDSTSTSASDSTTLVFATVLAGYRLQPPDGGFMFRVGASPMVVPGYGVLPWGYLSLGGTF